MTSEAGANLFGGTAGDGETTQRSCERLATQITNDPARLTFGKDAGQFGELFAGI